MPAESQLITNISRISVATERNPLVIHAHALLLFTREMIDNGQLAHRMMAFSTAMSVPVFTLDLHGCAWPEYSIAPKGIEMNGKMYRAKGIRVITWVDGTELEVQLHNNEHDLDIIDVEGRCDEELITRKAAQYWSSPRMHLPTWRTAESVRDYLGAGT